MPRPRPRPDPCDCFDCADPLPSPSSTTPLPPHLASARQQPPPKCVLVLADGVLTEETVGGSVAPHTDAVARLGCTGVLSLAAGAGSLLEQVVLGAGQPTPSLPARFHCLSAALVTTDAGVAAALAPAALDAVRVLPRGSEGAALAAAAIELLGGSHALSTSGGGGDREGVELVVVHVCDAEGRGEGGDAATTTTTTSAATTAALTTIDTILQAVARLPASPSTVLTVLVLGGPAVRLPPPGGTPTSVPGVLRPPQSYQLNDAGEPIPLSTSAAFIAIRCVGVTRVDGVSAVDPAAAAAGGALSAAAAGAVLADVAFKLGRASKYGA